MSGLPPEQEELFVNISAPASGTEGRESARARLDALLVRDLRESLEHVSGELLETRKQMAASSTATSRHQLALVRWTIVLSVATLAYAVAAFLPIFRHPPEREWVLWGRDRDNVWTPRDIFIGSGACRQGLLAAGTEQNRKVRELRRPDLARQDYFECWPDTVDPRGPKVK